MQNKNIFEIISLIKEDVPNVARFFMGEMKKYCNELGMSHLQGTVLLHLLWEERHITQSEICYYMGANASMVSRMIDELEDMGLVKRENSADDRREHIMVLTDIGKSKVLALDKSTDGIYSKVLYGLTEYECETIKEIFEKIKGNIK